MPNRPPPRWLLWLATAAAGTIPVSIALSQTLLGLTLLLFLVLRRKLTFPRIWMPLASLFVWTIIADLLSPDPWGGRAQIRKFFVFMLLPVIFTVFVEYFSKARDLILTWILTSTASGLWGLVQFVQKYRHARLTGEDFYATYVGHRITGFESHWMTFGALQLAVLSIVLAHWFFARSRLPRWAYASMPVLLIAIVLGETRSIWIATIPATLYLLWCWRPRATLFVPLAVALIYLVSPATTKERFQSLISPHGETDSNRHRIVTFRTGLAMVRAHPVFGLGPEQIGPRFQSYVPADVRRPLPVGYYGHLHNIYLQYAAERGIPGLLLVLWFIGWTLYDCLRALRRPITSETKAILHATVAVIIGILVGGIFEYNLGDSEVLMLFVSVVGLGYAAVANAATAPLPDPVGNLSQS